MKKILLHVSLLSFCFALDTKGTIFDKVSSETIMDATVCDRKRCVKSDENGTFKIHTEAKTLHVLAHGYRPYKFTKDINKTIYLEPIKVHALYLTFWGASPRSKTFANTLELLNHKDINSVIVDIKNEYGYIVYNSHLFQAKKYGAYKQAQIRDIDTFIYTLKQKNAYLIARIVVFKDELQASNNEHYAIKRDGKIWRNHDNLAWVDPFDRRSWKYAVDIAVDAAKRGFDEINFDYIRFPAREGIKLSEKNTYENRIKTITAFLKYAKTRLRPYGVFLSVDTFGNICWAKTDCNIGQTVGIFEKYVDYLCPMVYPSSFANGSFGHNYPSEFPHEVVYKSIAHITNRIEAKRIRPWIQAFRDYTRRRKHYGAYEIQEQMRVEKELGTNGWMIWSPRSKYYQAYFEDNSTTKGSSL